LEEEWMSTAISISGNTVVVLANAIETSIKLWKGLKFAIPLAIILWTIRSRLARSQSDDNQTKKPRRSVNTPLYEGFAL
jgi:hypothetical protein